MKNRETSKGWSLNQGLAAQYAAQAGIDPDLAAEAGEAAWDVLKALRDATDERDPRRRAKRVTLAKRRLNKAGFGRHRDLAKSIQTRLASLEGARPSLNPATGLQEFFDVSANRFQGGLQRRLNDRLKQFMPMASLDDDVLNPNVEHTPEYQSERILYKQGTPFQQAQRALDAATAYYGHPNAFDSLKALTSAVNKRWIPTNTTAGDVASSPAETRDLYKSQGIDPDKFFLAPISQTGDLNRLARAKRPKTLEEDPFIGHRMAASHPDVNWRVFIDEHGNMRDRIDEVKTNDPMYGVYSALNDMYGRSQIKHDQKKALDAGSSELFRMYPWGKHQMF